MLKCDNTNCPQRAGGGSVADLPGLIQIWGTDTERAVHIKAGSETRDEWGFDFCSLGCLCAYIGRLLGEERDFPGERVVIGISKEGRSFEVLWDASEWYITPDSTLILKRAGTIAGRINAGVWKYILPISIERPHVCNVG